MGTIRHATTTSELNGAKVGASEWDADHDINLSISDIDGLQDALDAAGGDVAIADVTGLQAALDAKADDADLSAYAPKASPALTGTPTAPTAAGGTNTTQIATTAFVKAAIDALLDGAPGALDTLNELAAAVNDDASFAASVTAALAGKLAASANLSDVANPATARGNLGLGSASVLDETTTAQYRANTADKALSTDQVWAAADYVALTDAATVAVDMSTGFNFSLTIGGNRTLGAPSNAKNGQTGAIVITQDGTGSRTLAYHANWKFAGGTDPTLSTAAGAVDVLFYQVISSTSIVGNLVKAIA